MQFNQITYFLRACDTLNFTRAAEICHVSQPSLSTAIQKLEDELGGELFSRQGRSVVLTPLGAAMRTQLGQIEQAKERVSRVASEIIHGDAGAIDVGLMCTLSAQRLLPAIALFAQEHSRIELLVHDIWGGRAQELLLSGALDCVVMAHTADIPDRFAEHPLTTEPMLLAMNDTHELSARKNIGVDDLHGQRYVDRLRCEFRDAFFHEIGSRSLDVQTVMRSEREDLICQSISEGIGVAMMPQSVAVDAGLQTRELSDMSIVRRISVVTVKDRELKPGVQRFISLVCSVYDQNFSSSNDVLAHG